MMADRDDQGQLIWYAEPEVHLAIAIRMPINCKQRHRYYISLTEDDDVAGNTGTMVGGVLDQGHRFTSAARSGCMSGFNNYAQQEQEFLAYIKLGLFGFEFILKHIDAWLLVVIGEVLQSQEVEEFVKILHNSSDIFKHINWQVLLTNKEVTFWKYICPLSTARLIL